MPKTEETPTHVPCNLCRPPALTLDQVLQAVVHVGNAGLNNLGRCTDSIPDCLTEAAAVLAQLAAALAQAVRDVTHSRLVGQGVGKSADLACKSLQALANTLQQVGSGTAQVDMGVLHSTAQVAGDRVWGIEPAWKL